MIRLWYRITWCILPILVASIIASGELFVTYEPSMNAYAAASKGPNLGSQRASLETHTPTQASPSPTTLPPNSAFCTLTIQNVTPDLRIIAQRYQRAFKVFCPELAKRFALRPDAVGNVILTFSTTVPAGAVAVTSGNHIEANPQAMKTQNGRTVGVIVHETEHVMQFTSPAWFNVSPGWFTEGLADYVRTIYGPLGDAWSMPPVQPPDSYERPMQ
jgi:Plant Basic Secretory Protein.